MNLKATLSALLFAGLAAPSAFAASDGTITFDGEITNVSCSVSGEGGVGPDFTVSLAGVDGSKFTGIGTRVGKPGQWVRNTNGTFDVGALQFNTSYLRELSRYGISAADVAAPGCYPFLLAAWRIRGHLQNDTGDVWKRAANYHSRTARFNAMYRTDLMRRAARWTTWLDTYFPTHDVVVDANP